MKLDSEEKALLKNDEVIIMDYYELLEKYDFLLDENNRLIKENSHLKTQLGLTKPELPQNIVSAIKTEKNLLETNTTNENHFSDVTNASDPHAKISLFMSLFNGRDDVYAKRWENKRKVTFGYSPVCLNLWQSGVCGKPKISCSKCKHKSYATLDEGVIENHLRGNIVMRHCGYCCDAINKSTGRGQGVR
ncbi:MAG: hypothetical protein U9Q58_01505 [Pseudomonadota bacterium]|nr:hypothetical protein [Pseudomonadota bacterium]